MARFMLMCEFCRVTLMRVLTFPYCRYSRIPSQEGMAAHVGQHRKPFLDAYPELTMGLQLKFLDYVKMLLEPMANGTMEASRESPGQASGTVMKAKMELGTEDGFPVMPEVNEKLLKDDLEDLLRHYLTAQYSE